MMNSREKLRILQKLDEKKLTSNVLMPLFREIGYKDVIDNQGNVDKGKDIIFYEENRIGEREYIAVQAKAAKIHGVAGKKGNASEILTQAQQAFTNPFVDVYDGKQKRVDKVFIVSSYDIGCSAKESIHGTLHELNNFKYICFVDGSKLIDLIDKHMPSIFCDEHDKFKKYFNTMKKEFEKIKDISAIGQREPIPLEEIYVSLKIIEKIRDIGMPFEPEEKIYKEGLIRQKIRRPATKERTLDAEKAVKEHNRIVIVGAPGAGKTTLLKHLALISCKENLEKQEWTNVPVHIILRCFSESNKDMREYIDEVFEHFGFPKAKDILENDLKEGKYRLLLDGFDELATKERQGEVAKQIHRFIALYPKVQIIVTSRIAGYHDELKGFTKQEIMPFNDKQIEKFIDNWFSKTNPAKAKSMYNAIKENGQIKAIARNPLMIAIIATIYEEDRELPKKRAELCRRCVEVLLNRWDVQKRLKNKYSSEEKEFILRKLAFYGHTKNKRILTEEEVMGIIHEHLSQLQLKKKDAKPIIDEIWKRSNILRQISMHSYDFLHLSFQEYFTALELKEQENGISTIIKNISKPWWEEPLLLYVGISNDASVLIKRVKKEVPEDIFYSNLMFFGKCVACAEHTESSLREEVVENLWSIYKTGEFKLLRDRAMAILALIKPDSILDSLIKDLNSGTINIRWNAADALGDIKSDKAIGSLINALKNSEDSDVRWSSARALGQIGSDKAIEPLINALNDRCDDVRMSATEALGVIGNSRFIGPLIEVLKNDKDESGTVQESAAHALGRIGDNKTVRQLIDIIKSDEDRDIRCLTMLALGQIGSDKAIEPLIEVFKNDKEFMTRNYTINALVKIGADKVLEFLVDAAKSDDDDVIRLNIAYIAQNITNACSIGLLINALNNDSGDVLKITADGYGDIESINTPLLTNTLENSEDYNTRIAALYALQHIESDKVIPILINVFKNDKDKLVRAIAARVLGHIGDERAFESLICALKNDKSIFVLDDVINSLGNIGDQRAIEPLINILESDNICISRDVIDEAFISLEKISKRTNKRIIFEAD